jgi:hypothetical protein
VASAGGKISCASVEVQPGATLFCRNNKQLVRKLILVHPFRACLVLLLLAQPEKRPKKEQKPTLFRKIRLGATYSHETGCTLFALLNSIRGQGATGQKDRCAG